MAKKKGFSLGFYVMTPCGTGIVDAHEPNGKIRVEFPSGRERVFDRTELELYRSAHAGERAEFDESAYFDEDF